MKLLHDEYDVYHIRKFEGFKYSVQKKLREIHLFYITSMYFGMYSMRWKFVTLIHLLYDIYSMLVCILLESLKVWMDNIEHIFLGMVEYDSQ